MDNVATATCPQLPSVGAARLALGGQLQALLEQLAAAGTAEEREAIVLGNDGCIGTGGMLLLPVSITIECEGPVPGETWEQHRERVASELAAIAEIVALTTRSSPWMSIAGRSLAWLAPLPMIAALASHPRIARIGLRRRVKATAMNRAALATGLGPDCEFRRKYTGKGVKIAVVDSGIDRSHPCLKVSKALSVFDETEPDGPGEHATHVAGIVGCNGLLAGFAPDAEILCVKAMDRDGNCDHHLLSEGISLALEAGADVILVSGGFNYLSRDLDQGHGGVLENDDYQSLNRSVSTALEFGAVVVAAAGNLHDQASAARARGMEELAPNELLTPGIIDGVITVGAVDNDIPAKRAGFSSFDRSLGGLLKPEIVAPGIGIRSTIPVPRTAAGDPRKVPADRCFGQRHGTSQAAPMVAAAVAMLIQRRREEDRSWTPAEIKEELLDHYTARLHEEGTGRGMLRFPS